MVGLFAAFATWIVMIATKEEKQRVVSLLLVFFVVIFFWMGFHQNGLTLTWFARDYSSKSVDSFTFLFFTLKSLIAVLVFIAGVVMLLGFLIIHIAKDLTAETAAWYFHSTPVWLIVMAIATGIYFRELRKLKKEGVDVDDLFSQLPPE